MNNDGFQVSEKIFSRCLFTQGLQNYDPAKDAQQMVKTFFSYEISTGTAKRNADGTIQWPGFRARP